MQVDGAGRGWGEKYGTGLRVGRMQHQGLSAVRRVAIGGCGGWEGAAGVTGDTAG